MDAMPFRIATPSGDFIKILEPLDAKHIENVAVSKAGEYLPAGIGETDEEKRKHWFIGSLDCGTTSSRFLIFDSSGHPVASHQIEFTNLFPESG
jgi:glycerol kinase